MTTPPITPNQLEALVEQIVGNITVGAQEQGMDVSMKDVGWIVSNFIEGLLTGPMYNQTFNQMMQAIADAAAAVKDEEG